MVRYDDSVDAAVLCGAGIPSGEKSLDHERVPRERARVSCLSAQDLPYHRAMSAARRFPPPWMIEERRKRRSAFSCGLA
jgi:hypothetical protein